MAALEGSMYHDLIKQRLAVISKFTGIVDADEKEKVLAQCLFQNLWLLDPGWERASGSERIEQRLKTEYGEFADGLDDEKSKGRTDIRYRSNAGEHIIIELKRAGRSLTGGELWDQGFKYKAALEQVLRAANGAEYVPNVSIVFVLGKPVAGGVGPQELTATLRAINARVVYYETLIESARAAYSEFMAHSQKADAIDRLIERL